MPALPAANAVVGVLVSKSPTRGTERRWNITGNDVLWLGRMCVAEDGPKSATETTEHAYERGRAMVSMILRRLGVWAFSGPYTGPAHLLRGDANGTVGWSSPLRYQQGRESSSAAQTRPWSDIPDYFQRAVLDTVTGRVPLSAAHVVDAAEGGSCAGQGTSQWSTDACFTERGIVANAPSWKREFPGLTRSWLISTTTSRAWPEDDIYIEGGARASDASSVVKGIGGYLLLAAVAGGAFYAYRRLRKR